MVKGKNPPPPLFPGLWISIGGRAGFGWEWGRGGPKQAWCSPHVADAESHVTSARGSSLPPGASSHPSESHLALVLPKQCSLGSQRGFQTGWVLQFPTRLCPRLGGSTSLRLIEATSAKHLAQCLTHSRWSTKHPLPPLATLFPISPWGISHSSDSDWAPATWQACVGPRPKLQGSWSHLSCGEN